MSKPSQLPRRGSSINAPASGSAQNGQHPSSALQPKAAILQPLRATVQLMPARKSASGVIQANIIGGTQALRARLALLRAPVPLPKTQPHSIAQPKAGANFKHLPARPQRPQTIQRKSGNGVEAFQVPLQPKSGGQPIPDQVRAKMETAFGMDFSDVRVHVGQEASSIGAIAYTWGTNIHFAPGQYNPHTIQGQKLLGHELWHVVQQKSGRVSNPFGSGVAVVQDHALEAEADRMGVKAAMTALVQKQGD